MLSNLKVGDKVFAVYDFFEPNIRKMTDDMAVSIEEEIVYAIIDFGNCKRLAFGGDGYTINDYLDEDEHKKVFTNYDDALEYAKDCVYRHFIDDNTERGKKQ